MNEEIEKVEDDVEEVSDQDHVEADPVDESADPAGDDGTDGEESSRSDTSTDVSGGDSDISGNDLPYVSAGDVEDSQMVLPDSVGYTLDTPVDYSDSLDRINGSLSLIAFLILFIWCEIHIKNAVRSFTGRGIK